jgi:hypothetical protein
MAWRLAWDRKQDLRRYSETVDIERGTIAEYDLRGWCTPEAFPASREYYRILDRISRGEQP